MENEPKLINLDPAKEEQEAQELIFSENLIIELNELISSTKVLHYENLAKTFLSAIFIKFSFFTK